MSATLVPFAYGDATVRVVTIDGEPWFVLTDLCKVLRLGNVSMTASRIADDMRGVTQIDTLGGAQQMTIVSEPGMYEVVIRSDKPEAATFRRWITSEVLPSIRRTGGYRVESITKRELALMVVEAEDARELAEQRARELAPAARAWSTMVACAGDYAVDEAAKVLSRDPAISTGRNRLFETMREQGWIYRSGHRQQWHAYQSQIECGRLAQKMASGPFLNHRTGELELPAPTIRITAKGLSALHRILGGTADLDSLLDSEVAA
ncbi:phage antirepressor [Lactobacillus amylovorus]|uniref:phage antirepressor n=1 Tax=Bacillati TaxID=1783272 RepID=UPI003F8991B5